MFRFAIGEVYKSESREGVVMAVDDEGRRGQLKFDDGEISWHRWAAMHQLAKWNKVS